MQLSCYNSAASSIMKVNITIQCEIAFYRCKLQFNSLYTRRHTVWKYNLCSDEIDTVSYTGMVTRRAEEYWKNRPFLKVSSGFR